MAMQSTSTSSKLKVCCNCGDVVSGRKRMRDWENRYWCERCGEADNKRKRDLINAKGTACADCRKKFPENRLQRFGNMLYCRNCYKKLAHMSGGGGLSAVVSNFQSMEPAKLAMIAGGAVAGLILLIVILVKVF
jgi:hypothetical protein